MKRITKRKVTWTGTTIVLALLLALASQGAAAQPQQVGPSALESAGVLAPSSTLISYQGTLTDENGNPINTTVTMKFALYDASGGGTRKWGTETQSVQVTNGLFNVLLGSVLPIDPASLTGDLWLDIKVNDEQLTPRERLTSVVYATEARTLPDWAQTRGSLLVNGTLVANIGQVGMNKISLIRLDETGRTHEWAFWHMNQDYGMNTLDISEYRTDSNGVSCGGNPADGAICAARFTIASGGNVGIGTVSPSRQLYLYRNSTGPDGITVENALASDIESPAQIDFKRTAVAGSQWASVGMDHTGRDFFIWVNGADRLKISENGSVSCGALTEAGLQTPEEREAGGSDRFEEGDLLCWGIDQLEKCSTANDRLVQAVADSNGQPIVIGAEAVKVLGPVKRGDILVASSVPGYAMVNNDPASGSVIAQALQDFDGTRGIIRAMIRKW